MKKLLLLILALSLWTAPAWAGCLIDSGTFTTGQVLREVLCDTSGNQRVTISGSASGGLGTANAAAPTLAEGAAASFSYDLAGNARVTLGTLISGEDQTHNLLMTSGGSVRGSVGNVGAAMVAAGDATPTTAVALPVGSKTFYGSVDGTGAVTQTQKIYGGVTSGVTATTGELLCTLTLSGTTHAHATCPVVTANFLFYTIVTSATTGTGASGNVTAMY